MRVSLAFFHHIFLLIILSLLFFTDAIALAYSAKIVGIKDPVIEQAMINASPILSKQRKEANSLQSLKVQAISEKPSLLNIAAYYGFFNCTIEVRAQETPAPTLEFQIDLGKRFVFQDFELAWNDEDLVKNQLKEAQFSSLEQPYSPSLADVPSFQKGQTALGKKIALIDIELVESLRGHGYAFAKVLTKEIIASRKDSTVSIKITVQTGPKVFFGPTHIIGANRTLPEFFATNQEWKAGAIFNPKYLYRTEMALRESGLFQTVQVEESHEAASNWTVPINIIVTENKPRTIGAGVSYTSTYGGGVTGLWEHRNIAGCGQKLTTKLELWQKMRTALFSLTIPDFARRQQDLLWLIEYDQQSYMPFSSRTIKGSVLLDRQLNKKSNAVFGLCLQRLESTGIIGHKLYRLFKLPLQYKWSNANHLLDPTTGSALHIRLTPSWQIVSPHYTYVIQNTTLASYTSFFDDMVTLAGKACVGNIFASMHNTIPLPDKFFGGSDSSLRGYKTGSVSPTNSNGKLIGGRSIVALSLETRLRQANGLGYVAFFDIGQVFAHSVPTTKGSRLLQSVGIGFRYTTPIGPLRLDVAFPLQRRHNIDPPFQLYFSIGQAF